MQIIKFRKALFVAIFFAALAFLASSCSNKPKQTEQAATEASDSLKPSYAANFSIVKKGDITILSIGEAWRGAQEQFRYVLYPKGSAAPKGYENAVLVPVPLERVICTGTSHAAMLDLLNLSDKIVAIADGKYIYNEKVRQRIASGNLPELGNDNGINYEKALMVDAELVFSFSFGRGQSHKKFQEIGLPVVMLSEFMEDHPLGRAEWLLFMSYFFGKEKEAEQKFKDLAARYENLKASLKNLPAEQKKPSVLIGLAQEGTWFVAGGKSFIARFIADAGGHYPWADNEERGGLPLDFETVLHKAENADYWINVILAENRAQLLKIDGRYKSFKAFEKGNIYSYTARKSENGGYDFFESAIVKPDLVLADLIKIFYPDLLPEQKLYYYKKLDS
jgi:iron complex transport system substrate-binding protein